jgi:hypothetical protein
VRYRYVGPGPQEDGGGGLVRPGEERDFDEEPAWGPWEPVPEEDGGAESPAEPPATQPPTPAPSSPAAPSTATAATAPAPAAGPGKGE